MNLFLEDILSQPAALRGALKKTDLEVIKPLRELIETGRVQRVILTGMGASFYGLYPAWLRLAGAGLSAIWVDAAELIHNAAALIDAHTLVWVASQSGCSAEVIGLLELCQERAPAALLALTNDPHSPLGEAGAASPRALLLLIQAEAEHTPSTRTYSNTLALSQLAAAALIPASGAAPDLHAEWAELERTADAIEAYLEDWQGVLSRIAGAAAAGKPPDGASRPAWALIGRGVSLASALAGALGLQEAARIPALGMQAAQFRHGPLEMSGAGLSVWVFEGQENSPEARLNRKLWSELRDLGANAWLLANPSSIGDGGAALAHPSARGIGLPLAQVVPLQLLSYHLAEQAGFEPGTFRAVSKVTEIE